MATINYNGMELEEVTTPQIFDPPRRCVVWDDNDILNRCFGFEERLVTAILPTNQYRDYPVILEDDTLFQHCALLPDPPKPRRATNRELAKWLAQGNGELCNENDNSVLTTYSYEYDVDNTQNYDNDEVWYTLKVRKWSDTEWHEPTVEYMFWGDK